MNFAISEKAARFPGTMPSVCACKKETGYASWAFKNVGLSNICYTVLDEIMECIFWRFPSKRSHWEAVIISIIISFELYSEIFKREETMRGIKAFVILAMTAFYFPIVPWGKGTNLFVLDA